MMTSQDIEIAVANYFSYRQNVIVPNIYWGLGLRYEADLVVLRPSGYAIEVEIKITRADIKADLNKRFHHDSNKFRQLWFAVPDEISDDKNIPAHAGILSISPHHGTYSFYCQSVRSAKLNRMATKFTEKDTTKLLELGCMRIWTLKTHIANQHKQIK